MPTQDPLIIFMVKLPQSLKSALEAESLKTSTTMSQIVKEALYTRLHIKPPQVITHAHRYATLKERIQAQKQREKERNELIHILLAEHRKGNIKLPPAQKPRDNTHKPRPTP